MLAHLDYLDEAIKNLNLQIEKQFGPFAKAVEWLRTIPGVDRRTAQVVVADIRPDMSRFPTAGHLVSWRACGPATMKVPENDKAERLGKEIGGSAWL